MRRQTIYGRIWECLRPGCWRSDCGWFVANCAGKGLWVGQDLSNSKTTLYADSLTGIVWQTLTDAQRQRYSRQALTESEGDDE